MFTNAVFRLTLWYLLLITILSLGFSVALFKVSTQELDRDQERLQTLIQRSFFGERQPPGFQEFSQARLQQIHESRDRVRLNLIYFNLIILISGGAASYLLARRTLQPIEESLEAQARFTSDASHELRTPLTAMKSEIEVALRDKQLTLAESKELHRSTLEEIGRLEALSSGLLRLAQQDGNQDTSSFEPLALSEIFEEAQHRMSSPAKQRDITISADIKDEIVEGDRWSLVELFSILIDNAIKYSPVHSTILISSFIKHHPHEVGVNIKDSGSGIAEADLPHIFDRFYRADQSRTSSSVSGYGLGLSIANKIIDLHRGSIEVDSTVGQGSTFTVLLPVAKHNVKPVSRP